MIHRWPIGQEVYSDGTTNLDTAKASKQTCLGKTMCELSDFPTDLVDHVSRKRRAIARRSGAEPWANDNDDDGSSNGTRVIEANPSAAAVWSRERANGAPWRERAERLQQIEDERAKKEIQRKRITLLAKQTSIGMKKVYNAHFDAAELIPLLEKAEQESQKRNPDPVQLSLLKAVLRYDLKTVCSILNVHTQNQPPTPSLHLIRARQQRV